MKIKIPSSYELLREENLEDINAIGMVLVHKKTGARIALVSNDDDNKVFYIGFRTPPADSTGVAHIIEHSVLCGSKNFPVKDPFIELVKGSLNTFLNAITYPDKTMYPVASMNSQDFKNLMHVYMDAVFYPNIYQRKEIFEQEGWHYSLDDENGELT
jgi:Zn-dependent M16 (insulinase) family peptidase